MTTLSTTKPAEIAPATDPDLEDYLGDHVYPPVNNSPIDVNLCDQQSVTAIAGSSDLS